MDEDKFDEQFERLHDMIAGLGKGGNVAPIEIKKPEKKTSGPVITQ